MVIAAEAMQSRRRSRIECQGMLALPLAGQSGNRQLQAEGLAEVAERFSPKYSSRRPVLRFEPCDITPVGCRIGQHGRCTRNAGLIETEHLVQNDRQGPAIRENVMVAPHEMSPICSVAQPSETHQG